MNKYVPNIYPFLLVWYKTKTNMINDNINNRAIPGKNILWFGHCPNAGWVEPKSKLFKKLLKKISLFLAKFLVGVQDSRGEGVGGPGNFDNVQIGADFFSGLLP